MAWPRRIYVATTALGVYYTENFVDPTIQPTWTTVNTGLAATDCREFHLDPLDNAGRQYVSLQASRTLYRRENGGSWTSILTSAQIAAITGQATTLLSFHPDPVTAGRIYVMAKADAFWEPIWSLRSDDYGATWPTLGVIRAGWYTYSGHCIRSAGSQVYASGGTGGGSLATFWYSSDSAATWAQIAQEWLANNDPVIVNQLLPNQFYTTSDPQGNTDLRRITNGGVGADLQDGLGPARQDAMWFDPTDADHQRLIRNSAVYSTTDEWTNVSNGGAISPAPYSFAAWAGADTDQILVGITHDSSPPSSQPHVIGALYGEDDTTAVGIGGANAATSPYTDSIPFTCGGLAVNGIAAVDAVGIIHTYAVAMPGYTDAERGTPMEGDRASWETGDTHADDWDTGDSHHAATTVGTDASELLELDGQEIQFVAQAANTFLAGPTSGADADPTFRVVVPGDLPAHTHVETDITDLDHTDTDAIHDNEAGEIHAITEKTTPAGADELVLEDSADTWAKKRVTIANLLAGTGAVIPLFSQVADTDVENTVAATSMLGSGRGTKTIAANEIDQGTVIVIVGHGYLSTTGEPTLKISVTLGGSEVCATEVFTTADTITDQGFTFRAEIVCRSTGATGSVVAGGTFEYDAGNQHKLQKTSTTAINTTGTLAVDVTATWGTASASNTLTCQVATIQLIKADELAVAAPSGLTAVEV